ncbi:MAG: DUF4239 domain-containing protein [Acidobacteriaceae bacterium]|nr:DUF4239 domain-containing protein [Acidobacteriaceae bacterium]
MLTTWQDVVIVILIVSCALLFKLVIDRMWTREHRRTHNDLIGWQLSILGTTYAVIVGFMLYAVWNNFGLAEVNADTEANALVNVYRLADGLPAEQRDELKGAARAYADVVLEKDWPAMAQGYTGRLASHEVDQKMWRILMTVKGASGTELTAEDHALYELSTMAEHRRLRQLQSVSRLPGVLWFVLVSGGALSIMSSCMFGSESSWLHGLQVFAFSLLVALALVAIADIDRPYQGSVHVADTPFRRAQLNMSDQ